MQAVKGMGIDENPKNQDDCKYERGKQDFLLRNDVHVNSIMQ